VHVSAQEGFPLAVARPTQNCTVRRAFPSLAVPFWLRSTYVRPVVVTKY
jgi:hypothetical protein